MGVVLLQEILRYNHLINQINESLIDLEKGIKGEPLLIIYCVIRNA